MAPTAPAPKTAIAEATEYVPSAAGLTMRRAICTMDRYRKNMVNAEHRALIALTAIAAFSGDANIEKNLANSWNTGFPGG